MPLSDDVYLSSLGSTSQVDESDDRYVSLEYVSLKRNSALSVPLPSTAVSSHIAPSHSSVVYHKLPCSLHLATALHLEASRSQGKRFCNL